MKTLFLLLLLSTYSSAQKVSPIYTSVNDKKSCEYKETKNNEQEIESCEYVCKGPNEEIKTRLQSCAEYENLFFLFKDKWYSTWNAMSKVGGQAGLGNKKGLVEWVFLEPKKPSKIPILQGLIVRFNGQDESMKNKSELGAFKISDTNVCWVGNFKDNSAARKALTKSECKENLTAEKK